MVDKKQMVYKHSFNCSLIQKTYVMKSGPSTPRLVRDLKILRH